MRPPKARLIKSYAWLRKPGYCLPAVFGNWDHVGYGSFLPMTMLCLGDTAIIKLHSLKINSRAGMTTHFVLCLPGKHEDPSSSPRSNIREPVVSSECQHWEGRAGRTPGACPSWQHLVHLLWASEKSCHKKKEDAP